MTLPVDKDLLEALRRLVDALSELPKDVLDDRAFHAYSSAHDLLYSDGFTERFMGQPEPLSFGLNER